MIGAAMGWAVYSIYLLNWKSKFSLMARFTLISMFGTISLFPFYILEEIFYFGFCLQLFHQVLLLLLYILGYKNI